MMHWKAQIEIAWYYYNQKEKKASEMVSVKEKVDALVVLDPDALVELGEQAENGTYYGAEYTVLAAVLNLSHCWIMDILQILYFLMDMRLVIRA